MRQPANGNAVWMRRGYMSLGVLGLAALLCLGSPGCTCEDTFPEFPPDTPTCCCEFEWIRTATTPAIADVDVVLTGVDPSLEAVATPPQLLGVATGVPTLFQICVRQDHAIGASLTLEFRNQADNSVLGSAQLVYNAPCDPTIVPITQRLVLTSTDCADICCCDFRWLAPDVGDPTIDINILGAGAGLTATIAPSPLTGVLEGVWYDFQICVNDDHPIGATLSIEFRDAANQYAQALLTYDANCLPTITSYQPNGAFGDSALYSPDCGPIPACCCDVQYELIVPPGGPPTLNLLFEVDTGGAGNTLNPVTVTPDSFDNVSTQGGLVNFQLCVNFGHDDGESMDLIVRDRDTLVELGRIPVTYGIPLCTAQPGNPTGVGNWIFNCP